MPILCCGGSGDLTAEHSHSRGTENDGVGCSGLPDPRQWPLAFTPFDLTAKITLAYVSVIESTCFFFLISRPTLVPLKVRTYIPLLPIDTPLSSARKPRLFEGLNSASRWTLHCIANFDEYAGDAIYSSLHNPLASLGDKSLSSVASNATTSAITQYLATVPGLSSLPRDSVLRQCISLYGITYVGILFLYFSVATFSYYFIFDHRMKLHPRWLKNQVRKEIMFSLEAFPMLDLLTLPWFLGDVRGYSKLYDSIAEGPFGAAGGWKPWVYMAFSAALFLWFTDYCIYWIHRWLHIPFLYRRLHKPHHKWIIPSPFASHAFHPVDGYLQSVPYHMACYMFPIHKYMFIGLFSFVNLWSIFIHDSDMLCGHPLEHYINGPAHHTLHHIYFTCNYGQYFTWADKVGGSFRVPAKGDDPLDAVLAVIEQKKAGLGSRSGSEESLNTTRQRVLDLLADETTSESGSDEVDVATLLSVKKSQ